MNILYKYCDQDGIKIIETLELKLPYVTEVNDPLECLPVFYCPDDEEAMKKQWLRTFNRKNVIPLDNWEQILNENYKKGEILKELEESSLKCQKNMNQKSCLLSVSKTARNTVMWTHYSQRHRGIVIGIDFDKVFYEIDRIICGLKLNQVEYSEQRPKINILTDFIEPSDALRKTIIIKSTEWKYEGEFRTIFDDTCLMDLKQQGLADLKGFNGKKTWFLRFNPESIREVVFGLFAKDDLKKKVINIIKRPELQHIKLYKAEKSETYTFNLVEINN